ncbi:MAG: DNA alkylation repair protein [Faecalibacterium sp.]|nr:DNA alkylation repair protein [Ruminococcus sp.]MCM1393108.1 DNA alkylation repair protein [Ruminococcus sp.]MCM1485214.1 DNA alkylation repair protein [Faecalibacterium sp.]
MKDIERHVREKLFSMQDLKYKDFHSKLIPTIDSQLVIGVRTPELRRYAKEFSKHPDVQDFLNALPHKYYEENNLHGFLIELMKDYDSVIDALDSFLPYVDNWATCDLMRPKVIKRNKDKLINKIGEWLSSQDTYTIRFAIEMLMTFYLDNDFKISYADMVAVIRSDEYYINMMIAWYFATALSKQYDSIIPYIEGRKLDIWTHNKTIQKAIESRRITDEQKVYLRTLKR